MDNNPNPSNPTLKTAWGISILIKTPYNTILFDAGPNPYILKYNVEALGEDDDLRTLDLVVISHEHGDHVRGLRYIAKVKQGVKVYVPEGMYYSTKDWIRSLGLKVIEVYETTKICHGVAIIGEMYGPPYEQALAINVKGLGLIIVTGCSHPGVENIVRKALNELKIKPYAVIGGFHLAGAPTSELELIINELINLGVKKIYPLHCSGDEIRELLKSKYNEFYGEGYVGSTIEFKGEDK